MKRFAVISFLIIAVCGIALYSIHPEFVKQGTTFSIAPLVSVISNIDQPNSPKATNSTLNAPKPSADTIDNVGGAFVNNFPTNTPDDQEIDIELQAIEDELNSLDPNAFESDSLNF